jgi:peptidyl-prolyl cis-trans isomerase SurA
VLVVATGLFAAPAAADVVNRIVLRINDRIATLYDYEVRKDDMVREILRREPDEEERKRRIAEAGETVYADLYQELLLNSRADQLGISVTEAQVDAAVSQIKENFDLENDDELKAALAQSGMTMEQLRDQMRNNLRLQEVRGREIQSRVSLDEDDLRRYYRKNADSFRIPEQRKVQEVVVLEEGGLQDAEARRQLAAEIRAAVTSGKSLGDAVVEHSKSGATSNVIDLGWVAPGDLDKGLETVVWGLAVGVVSEPVAGRGGLHLLQVDEVRESRVPGFAEVSQRIQQIESERVFRQEIVKYMDELEKRSLIVARPPDEASGFRKRIATAPAESDLGDLTAPEPTPQPPAVAPPEDPPGR